MMAIFLNPIKTTNGQNRKEALKNSSEMIKKIRLSNSARSIDRTIEYLSEKAVKVGYKVK